MKNLPKRPVPICCLAQSLRSLRQVSKLRHGRMARRFAPVFRALGVGGHS